MLFLVSQLIRMGQEEALLDGLIYALMPAEAGPSAADGGECRETAVSACKRCWNHKCFFVRGYRAVPPCDSVHVR